MDPLGGKGLRWNKYFMGWTFCSCEIFDYQPRNRPTARKPCAA